MRLNYYILNISEVHTGDHGESSEQKHLLATKHVSFNFVA